jgi:hypothetical protein
MSLMLSSRSASRRARQTETCLLLRDRVSMGASSRNRHEIYEALGSNSNSLPHSSSLLGRENLRSRNFKTKSQFSQRVSRMYSKESETD